MTETTSIDEYPHKIFAGNLAFKTTEDELKEFFGVAGTVTKVNIITRGTRSLGYGFIAFSAAEECQAAVEKCHKKELGGREINVEVAKPKAELEAAKKERAAARAAKVQKKRKRFNKKKAARSDSEGSADKKEGDAENKDAANIDGDKKKKKRRPKKKVPKDPNAPKPEPRPRRVPTGEPSKTTVFVANLPFALDDAGLSIVFQEYNVKSAKVVTRRGTGRSKGFGFVELEDETEQQKVLAAPVFVCETRELNIKVALSDEKPVEENKA